jgi:hypothetical protein
MCKCADMQMCGCFLIAFVWQFKSARLLFTQGLAINNSYFNMQMITTDLNICTFEIRTSAHLLHRFY